MNILGPCPLVSDQRKFLLVAIDYFTKWVEAESLDKIIKAKVIDFVWKAVMKDERLGLKLTSACWPQGSEAETEPRLDERRRASVGLLGAEPCEGDASMLLTLDMAGPRGQRASDGGEGGRAHTGRRVWRPSN